MHIERSELNPTQQKQWNDTRTALIWHAPAFSHIFYTLLQNTGDDHKAVFTADPNIPIAATDGSNLILNTSPTGFFRFNLNMRVFIVAHEIMHCILNHVNISHHLRMRGKVTFTNGKSLDYDSEQMNCAEDYVINAILSESKIGQMPAEPDGTIAGLLDAAIATSKDNSLDTYQKIYKKNPESKKRFDKHLPPGCSMGKDPVSAAAERNQAAWDTEVASAIACAKAMGKLPESLKRALDAMLEPKVDWQEKIRSLFARKVGSGTFDWKRPDRRLITRDIYAPGRSGFGAGTVVVGVDTSGSVGKKELNMFFAEMAGILEDVKPKRLLVIWCDATVHRIDELEDASDLNITRAKGAPGGGGTDFRPVFKKIAEMDLQPEALVFLTDGMGSFPTKAPAYPVIWGNIYPASKFPFGDVVDIPKQAA